MPFTLQPQARPRHIRSVPRAGRPVGEELDVAASLGGAPGTRERQPDRDQLLELIRIERDRAAPVLQRFLEPALVGRQRAEGSYARARSIRSAPAPPRTPRAPRRAGRP